MFTMFNMVNVLRNKFRLFVAGLIESHQTFVQPYFFLILTSHLLMNFRKSSSEVYVLHITGTAIVDTTQV